MSAILELRDAFEKRLGERLRDAASTVEEVLAWSTGRVVEAIVETLRDLGKRRGHDVAPLRRGVGEIPERSRLTAAARLLSKKKRFVLTWSRKKPA